MNDGYYANNILKFVSSSKFKEDDDGFDGFMVRVELVKSRTNKASKFVNLIYNQQFGFDPVLSILQFATDNNLLDGRNPYKYFKSNKDIKFDSRNFRELFDSDKNIREATLESVKPFLEAMLSNKTPDD